MRAYRLLAASGRGGVFNVSSGRSVSAAELARLLEDAIAPIRVSHRVDPARATLHDAIAWWERHPAKPETGLEPVT